MRNRRRPPGVDPEQLVSELKPKQSLSYVWDGVIYEQREDVCELSCFEPVEASPGPFQLRLPYLADLPKDFSRHGDTNLWTGPHSAWDSDKEALLSAGELIVIEVP